MRASFLFPGQGSQKIGMGQDFYESSSLAKEMFELASDTLKLDFTALLFEENEDLHETEFSQPAIFLISAIAYSLYAKTHAGAYALGHSLGEFSALWASGALSFENAINLVHQRGLLMKKACEGKNAGMMAVVGLDFDTLKALCEEFQADKKSIYLANINNATQIVLAGKKKDLLSVEEILKQSGAKKSVLLNMSISSHCPLLKPMQKDFFALLDEYINDDFSLPVISNVNANAYQNKNDALDLLTKQLTNPVLYTKCIEFAEQKSDIFVEFGACVLAGLNRRISQKPTFSIVDMKSLEIVQNLQR